MKRLNLRLRITAAISIVCIAIIAALGGAFYMAAEQLELVLVEQLVGEELDFLIKRYQADPTYIPEPGPNVEYYIVNPDTHNEEYPVFLKNLENGHHEIDIGNGRGERDVMIRQVDATRFVVVYNIGPYEQREKEFKQLVMTALVVVMIFAIVAGYLLSGFLTKQLTLLAQRVSNLIPGSAHGSLLRDEQDQEVAMLANAFDQYHKLFLGMIHREQEFTANVSHELRTPLTAIRTSSELLLQDNTLSEKAQMRVRDIIKSVSDMAEHVNALLLLARQQEIGVQEEFGLRECAEDVLVPFREDIARKSLDVEIHIPASVVVHVNRQALQLVLGNLLRNAVNYTAVGYVHLNFHGNTIDVTDSGKGIAEDQLPHIFTRHYQGEKRSDGLGLGLDIAKRICDRESWKIEVRSEPGKGSTFSIVLPNE